MSISNVYQKTTVLDIAVPVAFVSNIQNDILADVTIQSIYPQTTPALTVNLGIPGAETVQATISGGVEGSAYGIVFLATFTSGFKTTELVSVGVQNNTERDLPEVDLKGYQTLLGSIEAGGSAVASTLFFLDQSIQDFSAVNATWEVVNSLGYILSQGEAISVSPTIDTFITRVQIQALVNVPYNSEPTNDGVGYQLRWTLTVGNYTTVQSETITILGASTLPIGPSNSVEVEGDPINLSIVTTKLYDTLSAEIYYQNTKVASVPATEKPARVASGYHYRIVIGDSSILQSMQSLMDSYTVVWKYYNSNDATNILRATSLLFVVSPSILSAVDYCKMQVSKARTTLFGEEDLLFDTPTVLAWLRRGRDDFNAAGGYATTFNMTNATGAIRSYWLMYSEIAMLRAQSLAEGEKSFNFTGQAISLDTDRSQYYDKLADALQQQADSQIRPFKAGLQMRGMFGGDGNIDGGLGRNRPSIAVTVTPASVGMFNSPYGRHAR